MRAPTEHRNSMFSLIETDNKADLAKRHFVNSVRLSRMFFIIGINVTVPKTLFLVLNQQWGLFNGLSAIYKEINILLL